ncbi:putative RNA-directed DNA polymerase from transposon BS, partial [Stegodyphus mimosarum]
MIKWKIKTNVQKSEAVYFTYKTNVDLDTPLKMYDINIPWAKQAKYLGIILDQKLTWAPHITYTLNKFRGTKALFNPLIARNSCYLLKTKFLYINPCCVPSSPMPVRFGVHFVTPLLRKFNKSKI